MGAYAIKITRSMCAADACGKVATDKVYNTYNAHIGNFCLRHATKRVLELNKRGGAAKDPQS